MRKTFEYCHAVDRYYDYYNDFRQNLNSKLTFFFVIHYFFPRVLCTKSYLPRRVLPETLKFIQRGNRVECFENNWVANFTRLYFFNAHSRFRSRVFFNRSCIK